MTTEINDLTSLGAMLNGGIASFCNISITQPFFTYKTYRQSPGGHPPEMSVKSLYRGYPINLVCDMTCQITNFYANHFFSQTILNGRSGSDTEKCLGGAFSGFVAAFPLTPCERVMILKQKSFKDPASQKVLNSFGIAMHLWKKEGVKWAFKGLTPTIAREMGTSTCFFGLSRIIRKELDRAVDLPKNEITEIAKECLSYTISGFVSGSMTNSFDLVKTRMQGSIGADRSVTQVVRNIVKIEGLRSLFCSGLGARAMTLGSTNALLGPIALLLRANFPNHPLLRASHDE